VDIEADDDFDKDEEEVKDDADDEGAVDLFEVNGVVMVAKAVGVVVGMCGSHEGIVLSVVISCRCKGVDDLAVRMCIGGVGDIGRDGMSGAGGKEVSLSANDHFQLAVEDKGNLFVGVAVFGKAAAFFDFPDGKGAFVPVHHFPKKTRPDLFGWDVGKILHERFCGEGKEKW